MEVKEKFNKINLFIKFFIESQLITLSLKANISMVRILNYKEQYTKNLFKNLLKLST